MRGSLPRSPATAAASTRTRSTSCSARWTLTRYRVLRRTVVATIAFVGILSALLVIPQVRAVAGGLLASSAVLGIVIGFASQRTIGNFVAGLLIAFTQPIRLGDRVEVDGVPGTVEAIP